MEMIVRSCRVVGEFSLAIARELPCEAPALIFSTSSTIVDAITKPLPTIPASVRVFAALNAIVQPIAPNFDREMGCPKSQASSGARGRLVSFPREIKACSARDRQTRY